MKTFAKIWLGSFGLFLLYMLVFHPIWLILGAIFGVLGGVTSQAVKTLFTSDQPDELT